MGTTENTDTTATIALESAKSAHHRIDGVEKRLDKQEENLNILHEMNKNIALIAQTTEGQDKEIKGVKKDVKELKEKPIKRWDLIIATIITAVTTALATAIVAGVLK